MGELHNDIQTIIDKDDDGSPLFLHFEHIPSNFVRIKIDFGDNAVPVGSKPLVALYMMNLLTTPVNRGGKRIEFEDLVLDLERETVAYCIGEESANVELLALFCETEPENYERIISWIRTILFDAINDPDRILSSLTKILADIPDEKRSGSSMMSAVNAMIQYKQESSVRATSTLSKALYLKRVRKMLEADEAAVLSQLRELCQALHRPENFRIFVSANIEKLSKPVSAWSTLIDGLDTTKPLEPIVKRKDLLSDVGRNPGSAAYIVPMSTIDSSFATLTGKGPDSYDHPDIPALMVAGAYMNAVEGPLWVAVRGTGLAYGTGFARSTDTGLYYFRISRSPDSYKAFTAAKEQVEGYATGKLEFNKFALEGAVSEIVLGMADEQPTMASAASHSFANQVIRGISKDWSHQMLAKVQAVKPDEIRKAMKKYMVPIFQPESSNLVITCAQIMKDGLYERFSREGYKPEVRALESFQDDYGLKGPLVDEADDDDDEDESSDGDDFQDTPESDEQE
jgi:Zn-dependent M16 (insulinase) family peptidase